MMNNTKGPPISWKGMASFMTFLMAALLPFLAFGEEGANSVTENSFRIDKLWILISAGLVFFMQVGFLCLEVGSVRKKSSEITALKNVGDWVAAAAMFFLFGWPLMFGHTASGLFGKDMWMLQGNMTGGSDLGIWVHFLYQLAFAATASTIISGALAERTSFKAYLVCSLIVTGLIYPIVGHWGWGNGFFADNQTFLTKIGFVDFAGSTIVHSVGGWIALIGIVTVGPRLGRFKNDGTVANWRSTGTIWTAMGTLILWFGWWGFNGGSTLAFNGDVGPIINNTNLGGSLGGLGALAFCFLFGIRSDMASKFLNGILGGLVSITACAHMVSPLSAMILGFIGGILTVIVGETLLKFKLDDPVGAVPVHLVCGIWGTLCVGLFGKAEMFPLGHTRFEQIMAQFGGIFATAIWCTVTGGILFFFLKHWMGLRVSPREELEGYDIAGVVEKKEDEKISEEEARKLLGL